MKVLFSIICSASVIVGIIAFLCFVQNSQLLLGVAIWGWAWCFSLLMLHAIRSMKDED
jgi:hypothetical protein